MCVGVVGVGLCFHKASVRASMRACVPVCACACVSVFVLTRSAVWMCALGAAGWASSQVFEW